MSNTAKFTQLQQLTLAELNDWAGATIVQRGKAYQRSGRARKLALTPDGALLAWVSGTERYATLVDVVKGKPLATCSCPYDGGVCKHAVAVVLACQMLEVRGHALPAASANDRRFAVLETAGEDWDADDNFDDEGFDEAVWDAAATQQSGGRGPTVIPAGNPATASLRSFLEEMDKDQLADLLMDMTQRFPEVQSFVQAQRSVETGSVDAPEPSPVRRRG